MPKPLWIFLAWFFVSKFFYASSCFLALLMGIVGKSSSLSENSSDDDSSCLDETSSTSLIGSFWIARGRLESSPSREELQRSPDEFKELPPWERVRSVVRIARDYSSTERFATFLLYGTPAPPLRSFSYWAGSGCTSVLIGFGGWRRLPYLSFYSSTMSISVSPLSYQPRNILINKS